MHEEREQRHDHVRRVVHELEVGQNALGRLREHARVAHDAHQVHGAVGELQRTTIHE